MPPTPIPMPQELVDHIVDTVASLSSAGMHSARIASERMRNMLSCTLVSRSFHYQARRHLFAHLQLVVGIFDTPWGPIAKSLLEALESDIELVGRVRSLRFIVDSAGRDNCRPERQKMNQLYAARILPLLTGLQHLFVGYYSAEGQRVSGLVGFNQNLRSAIWNLHNHPHLTSFELGSDIIVPGGFLDGWTNLKTLTIHPPSGIRLGVNGLYAPSHPIEPACIETLVSKNFDQIQLALELGQLSANFLSQLRALYANLEEASYQGESLYLLIANVSSTLQVLEMGNSIGNSSMHHVAVSRYSKFSSLRILRFRDRSLKIEWSLHCLANIVNPLLAMISSGVIEEVRIEIMWSFRYRDNDDEEYNNTFFEKEYLGAKAWLDMDRVLGVAPNFRRLDVILDFDYVDERVKLGTTRTCGIPCENFATWWTKDQAFPVLSGKTHPVPEVNLSTSCSFTPTDSDGSDWTE